MKKRLIRAAAMLALASAAPAVANEAPVAPVCPSERAGYTMVAEKGAFRIGFVPARRTASAVSDLYVKLTTPQRDYWFVFASSQGYGGISLMPVSNPHADDAAGNGPRDLLEEHFGGDPAAEGLEEILGSLRFIGMDAALDVAIDPPMIGSPAPAFVMLPEIGRTLWYEPATLTEDKSAERDPMPRGVFRLTGCLSDARPPAWP